MIYPLPYKSKSFETREKKKVHVYLSHMFYQSSQNGRYLHNELCYKREDAVIFLQQRNSVQYFIGRLTAPVPSSKIMQQK